MSKSDMDQVFTNLESLLVKDYPKIDTFIIENPGLTIGECISKIKFHNFTEDSFKYLIDQINQSRLTFNNLGPYKIIENKVYYNGKVKREERIELINRLQERLRKYEEKFGPL